MLAIGRARHPGPVCPSSNRLNIKFLNIGGWLAHGNLRLDCKADFLAVAELKLIPAGTRAFSNELGSYPDSQRLGPCQSRFGPWSSC